MLEHDGRQATWFYEFLAGLFGTASRKAAA